MRILALAAIAALVSLAGCTPPAAKKTDVPGVSDCPDDGPRLPGTGICLGRASAYFDPARLTAGMAAPEGCSWVINETMLPEATEAIVYNALSCKGKTTLLEFRGGARSASLGYVVSGFFDAVPDDYEPVRMFPITEVPDPKAMILDFAQETTEDKKEAAACELRPAGEGYPADALMVDVNAAWKKAKKIGDEAYAACGMYGVTDGQRFWLIRDGYAWFIDQGQDLPDFDAGSLTLLRKGADGGWGPAAAP
jgi:hypothetical protein